MISSIGRLLIIINKEPMILNHKPKYVILTRPTLSARLPAPTTNIPENNAVILTAILIVPILLLNDCCNVGTTFNKDCANNQKVTTPNTIPNINLLSP